MVFQSLAMILPRFFDFERPYLSPWAKFNKSEAIFVARSMLNKCANFMNIVQAVKKLNSISWDRLNFRSDGRLCVQLCTKTLDKRATSVAHLTNFSFEIFYAIFTQDVPVLFLYYGAKKSKKWPNLKSRGSCL